MDKPVVPPTLIYDHSSDPEEQLWDRLHERSRLSAELRVIVHLKSGSTLVGNLRYYDNFHLTIATGGQLHDVLYCDVAHILQASESV
jgi:sRNA-binding regulator protein Hfq